MNEYTLKSPFEVWWTTAEEFTENIPAISTIPMNKVTQYGNL